MSKSSTHRGQSRDIGSGLSRFICLDGIGIVTIIDQDFFAIDHTEEFHVSTTRALEPKQACWVKPRFLDIDVEQ